MFSFQTRVWINVAQRSGICDGMAIKAQNFNFAQKFYRKTTIEIYSFASLLQNRCACCTTNIQKTSFTSF